MDPSRPRAVTSSPGGLCALQDCGKVLQNEPTVSGVGQTHDGGKRLKFYLEVKELQIPLEQLLERMQGTGALGERPPSQIEDWLEYSP